MNKMYILLLTIFSLTNSAKYHSDYYNNFTNILNRYPKVDIDYIFSKSSSKSVQEENQIILLLIFSEIYFTIITKHRFLYTTRK